MSPTLWDFVFVSIGRAIFTFSELWSSPPWCCRVALKAHKGWRTWFKQPQPLIKKLLAFNLGGTIFIADQHYSIWREHPSEPTTVGSRILVAISSVKWSRPGTLLNHFVRHYKMENRMFGVVLEWFIRICFLFSFWASTTLQRPLGVLLQESCSFSRGGTGLHFIAQCWLCNVVVLFYRQGVSMCGVAELPLYRVPVCIVFSRFCKRLAWARSILQR